MLAAIIPVLTLALVIRTYFANLLHGRRRGARPRAPPRSPSASSRTRTGLRRSAEATGTLSDDCDGLDQPGDRSGRQHLPRRASWSRRQSATLFASGVLADAHARRRLPRHRAGAAAELRRRGRDRQRSPTCSPPRRCAPAGQDVLLTVPLDDFASARSSARSTSSIAACTSPRCSSCCSAPAIGLSMAERIADPVRRLTRATGGSRAATSTRRIAVKSADELRRLVDAFNSMAAELKAQRAQLERTHRLEAWAEMARQVAHEIKNPLTPIQLSAEHLRRVHADRGEPMGAVLENCVSLDPRAGPAAAADLVGVLAASRRRRPRGARRLRLPELVAEVVDPYRTGLAGPHRDRQPRVPPLCRRVLRRPHAHRPRACRTSSRTRCTRCPVPARSTIDATVGARQSVTARA